MLDSRRTADLYSETLVRWNSFQREMLEIGIRVGIVSTFRDFEMQNYLYEQGRTRTGRIVTYVRAGGSFHNVRRAVDVWPLDKDGKLNGKFTDSKEAVKLFDEIGRVGKLAGFQWGGDWKKPDRPHLQDGFCLTCNNVFDSARHFKENGLCRLFELGR